MFPVTSYQLIECTGSSRLKPAGGTTGPPSGTLGGGIEAVGEPLGRVIEVEPLAQFRVPGGDTRGAQVSVSIFLRVG